MFVSSYSTYINTNASDKAAKQRYDKSGAESKSFDSELSKKNSSLSFKSSNLPIDYISKSQFLHNKQELEFQKQQLQEPQNKTLNQTKEMMNKFSGQNSLLSAKSAYESNSKMFSLFQKPHATLDQTPKTDKKLPLKTQEAKENNLRHLMVNTYIANDKYYQVTA